MITAISPGRLDLGGDATLVVTITSAIGSLALRMAARQQKASNRAVTHESAGSGRGRGMRALDDSIGAAQRFEPASPQSPSRARRAVREKRRP